LGNRKRVTQADSQPHFGHAAIENVSIRYLEQSETFFLPVAWPQKFLSGALK
jgi:hypothetical protein